MIASVIITSIACITRWRLVQQSLQFYRLRTSTILVLLWLSIMGILSIISFPHLYHQLTQHSWTSPLTTQSAWFYLLYSVIISLLINLIVFYRAGTSIAYHQLILMITVAGISVILPQLGRYPLYYYLIAAWVEEYVKYYLGYGSFRLYGATSSDIILFGMLSGLGFACVENIVYLVSNYQETTVIIHNTARRIIGPIVHMVYSGGLAYGYWYCYRRGRNTRWLIVSGILITLIHTWYNSYITQQWWMGLIALLIIGYGIISWMIYQCDRLYFETKNNLKTIQ